MINIAVVEDEAEAYNTLTEHLSRYSREKKCEFNIIRFETAGDFLWKYKSDFDIVFMDVGLPDLNGIDLAKELRKLDKEIVLIFVTSMAQYAVKGYEVEALDFIVKPVDYFGLAIKLGRALERVRSKSGKQIAIATESTMVRVETSKLKYVEISGHRIISTRRTATSKPLVRLKRWKP